VVAHGQPTATVDQAQGDLTGVLGDRHSDAGGRDALADPLEWATHKGVVTDQDAAILLELARLEVAGAVRGLNSGA
jgi:hypothetical protein